MIMMKKNLMLTVLTLILLAPLAQAATVTVTQSGADTGTVMKGSAFTITVSGLSDSGTVTLIDKPTGFSTDEGDTKSFSSGTTSVSWTTASISQAQTGTKITVNIVTTGAETAESSTFDVVLPPSITISATPESFDIDEDSTYTANLNVQNTGGTTANSLVLSVSGTGMTISSGCSTISSIAVDSSSSSTCTVTASTAGTYTVTFTATPSNADPASDTVSVNVSGTGGGETPGGGGGGGGSGNKSTNATKTYELVPGIGLVNNTQLLAAIESVLGKGQLSRQAIENLLRLSRTITSDMEAIIQFKFENNKSKLILTIRYKGSQKARNVIVWDQIPKTFANSSDLITLESPGAVSKVVKKDPEYIFLYTEFSPSQQVVITYTTDGEKSSSLIENTYLEIYAEGLEGTAIPPGEQRCTISERKCVDNSLQECNIDGGWDLIGTCTYGCDTEKNACRTKPQEIIPGLSVDNSWIIVVAFVIVIVALALVYFKVPRK
jgi:hypothetical protein